MYAMYLRKSRDDDDLPIELLFKNHYTMLNDLAKKLNITISEKDIYKEVISGDRIANRPEMQKLLEAVSNGYYEGVFCTEISRLCRGSKIDQEIVSNTFFGGNCKIITPSKTYDLANEFDEEMIDFGLFMARREYQSIKKRLKRGREQSVKNGKFTGSTLPFGYNKEKLKGESGYKLIINEEQAEIVRLIFKLFLDEGLGTAKISNRLNDLGYISYNGDIWSYEKVRRILKNRIYVGELVHNARINKTYIDEFGISRKSSPLNPNVEYFKGLHEGIISIEDFNTVQSILEGNKTHRTNFKYALKNPFAGIIACAECGKHMVLRAQKNIPSQIKCNTYKCPTKGAYLYRVEEYILAALKKELNDYKYYIDNYEKEVIKEKIDLNKRMIKIDKELEKLNKQFNKCCEMLEKEIYTIEIFQVRSDEIKSKINLLNETKSRLKNELDDNKIDRIKTLIPILENVLSNYDTLSIEDKNKLLKSIIEKAEYSKTQKCKKGEKKDYFKITLTLKL